MIVTPKDTATAKRLLAEAEKQGLDPSVVVVADDGFDVPESVANPPKPKQATTESSAAKPTTSRRTRPRTKKE